MLRSVNDLKGCTIVATDGDVGEVVEFYFDDERWTVRYLIADTVVGLQVERFSSRLSLSGELIGRRRGCT